MASPLGTSIEYFPSISEVVPSVVPLTCMVIKDKGFPVAASEAVPVILICAYAVNENKESIKHIIKLLILLHLMTYKI